MPVNEPETCLVEGEDLQRLVLGLALLAEPP
jgi:hypothetical protein